jgi:hypothetical protein
MDTNTPPRSPVFSAGSGSGHRVFGAQAVAIDPNDAMNRRPSERDAAMMLMRIMQMSGRESSDGGESPTPPPTTTTTSSRGGPVGVDGRGSEGVSTACDTICVRRPSSWMAPVASEGEKDGKDGRPPSPPSPPPRLPAVAAGGPTTRSKRRRTLER